MKIFSQYVSDFSGLFSGDQAVFTNEELFSLTILISFLISLSYCVADK